MRSRSPNLGTGIRLRHSGFPFARNQFVLALVLILAPFGFADEPTKDTANKSAAPAAKPLDTPRAREKASNFTLPNAQDGMTRVKWPREKPVFLTFGEQASQSAIQKWTARMLETYQGQIEFVGVAWLQSVPESMHPAAAAVIKASHPDVLMDNTGSCAQRYQCKAGQVNAFVIAPDGTILKRIHEPMTEENFAEVGKLLTPVLKKK